MATLNVKNLPDALYRKLKARAKRERRSVAQEVTILLTQALEPTAARSILELRGLGKELWAGVGPVGLDTAIFIYFIEEHQRFLPVIAPLFAAADAGKVELVASALTLLEVLVVPYRADNIELAERYEAVLTRSRGIRMVDLGRDH